MNKKFLTVAIFGALYTTSSVAATLYSNEGTTLSVGGHMSVALDSHGGNSANGTNANTDTENEVGISSPSPRINITGIHELGNGYTVDARGEWATNMLNGGENAFTTRLGYLGISHEDHGRLVIGTQWAPYYNVAGVADMPISFANDFIYNNHGNLGTGRGNDMVSYRNSFDFNDTMSVDLGVAWQGKNISTNSTTSSVSAVYDDRAQVALTLNVANFALGYAYNGGDFTFTPGASTKDKAKSNLVSAKYGTYGEGLYAAAVYAKNENMNNYKKGDLVNSEALAKESTATEFVVAYAFSNSLNLSANYERVEDDKLNDTIRKESAIQAEYKFTPKFVGFSGYQFDLNDKKGRKKDDMWKLGVRYYL
ncbi:porin [Vibrio hannami]|uniref:porin n=1 Tax=Vibrio hannami TaxID=2717094 RepID=UPI00240EF6CA|nr:porin [Vibrio hannami]MDG3086333.1 porin [Vibrio hannami]